MLFEHLDSARPEVRTIPELSSYLLQCEWSLLLATKVTLTKAGADPGGWGGPGGERPALPVPLYLSHICHASNTEAEVLAVQGASDGAGDAGLAHTRGTVEAEDLALG